MERLTARTHDGHAYLANVKDDEQEVDCASRNTAQCIMDSWERLAAYEDTGLSPADIADLKNEHCLLCGKYKTAHEGSCDGCRWKGARRMPGGFSGKFSGTTGAKGYRPTNADRIRGMNDEEMAEFIDEISGFQADYLKYKGEVIDVGHMLDWLRQPSEE